MKKIPHPLPPPTPAEIELAKTDADARKRVRNQMLRVRRREEEIARLTAEITDPTVCDDGDLGDLGDLCDLDDNYTTDPVIRYVRPVMVFIDVLPCATACALVLAHRIAVSGYFPVRTVQHAGLR